MGMKLVKEDSQKVKLLQINVPGLIILMIGCLALIGWSIYQVVDENRFSKICVRTEGVVVDYDMYYDEDDDKRYIGIYEYTVNGEAYQVEEISGHMSAPEIGDKTYIFYDPQNPEEAKFSVGGLDGMFSAMRYYMIGAVGGFFFFIVLAMILAHYKVSTPWIQLCTGIALTLLGIGIPILTMGQGCPLVIFGLVGIYLVVRGYLQLRGKTEEDQEFQSQVGTIVGGAVKRLADRQEEDPMQMQSDELTPEDVYAAAENVGNTLNWFKGITSGISCIGMGLIFAIAGVSLIVTMPGYSKIFGVIFAVVGVATLIFGIVLIRKTVGQKH